MMNVRVDLIEGGKRVGLIKEERRVVPNIPIHSPSLYDFQFSVVG